MDEEMMKFNGREVVLYNKETGEEILRGESLMVSDIESEKEMVTYKDEDFEKEIDEETLAEMEETAKEYMDKNTIKGKADVIKDKMEETEKVAEISSSLKEHYQSLQEAADVLNEVNKVKDGGEDKTNPDYYRTREKESIEIMELKHGTLAVMSFCLLTSERYEYRVGNKQIQADNPKLDLDKADWYLAKYEELRDKLGTGREIFGLSTIISRQ